METVWQFKTQRFTIALELRDPMNRNCSIMREARGHVSICHYFPDMVREAIAEARKLLKDVPDLRKESDDE